jgi:DUF4097 and DUF4098 domain-containing protein YvlB
MPDNTVVVSVPGHAELHVSTRSGRVTVTADENADVRIESDAPMRGDKIEVDATGRVSVRSGRGGSGWLEIRCPAGSDIVVGTVSGKVELSGKLGEVRVTTVSGSIAVDHAEFLDVRSISGSIEVERCLGACRLQTKSGRTTVGGAGDAQLSTISGRIRLDNATGKVRMRTVSGKVQLGTEGKGDVAVETMSGSVQVEVPAGVRPQTRLRSLTGKPKCGCEEGDDCRISISSMTGKIEVKPT